MQKKKRRIKFSNHGYTLIELLIALSIFVLVVLAALGLFSMAVRGQRKVIAQQNVQENARFLLEFMAKEIRMSKITSNDTSGSTTLTLKRSDENIVNYSISGGIINRNGVRISSEEVWVGGRFYISGTVAGAPDNKQPRITIVLSVQSVGTQVEEQSRIDTQVTLSSRILDI